MIPKFKIGDEVQCISDPSRIGTVVDICERHADIQYYRVNFGSASRPKKPELDLRPYEPNPTPTYNLINGNIDSYQEFQRLITYQRIVRDNPLRNNIYAFNASRTHFYHYQFKPLLKFLDSPKHRLLIADEVGLGKTIEAGLILTELRARQSIQRVLVVCPANLTQKWKRELKDRFGEKFNVLSATEFMAFLDEYERDPEECMINGVISLESIRSGRVLDRLEELAPTFDMVIVDEAHHMRNFGRKQREAGVLLSRSSDSMVFLTATPVHLGSENLFSLLNILDDEEFPDFYTVNDRFQNNEPIVKAQISTGRIPPSINDAVMFLDAVSESPWMKSNPLYPECRINLLSLKNHESNSLDYRRSLLKIQKDLADLNLIGHIFTRTRKKDVQTNMAVRKAYPLRLKLSEMERLFYDAVTAFVRARAEENTSCPLIMNWMLIMPQRRMASSIPAMVDYYREYFSLADDPLPEDFEFIDEDDKFKREDSIDFVKAENILRQIIRIWPNDAEDSKYNKFLEMLRKLKEEESMIKVMVFAFFKDTLRYLERRLSNDGFICVLISGDVPLDERSVLVERFKDDESCEIILSSKVGSEGLDFQFCNILFNYDLPWNPMEVEQRIGRLDRIGQKADIIRIYHFWIEETIEQRILDKLYSRIDVFERSVGELEMILGEELSTLERDILSKKLSQEEEQWMIEQKAHVIEGRMIALKQLEKEAAQFIGTDQYFDEEVKTIRTHRRYITGKQMHRFIVDFIKSYSPRTRMEYDDDKNIGRLYTDEQLRSILTDYVQSAEANKYFASAQYGVSITFDSQTAFDNPNVDFLNVLHPLVRAIVDYYDKTTGINSNAHHVVLKSTRLKNGLYLYFVYKLRIHAARGANTLEMIILDQETNIACSDENSEIILGEMVENGKTSRGVPYEVDEILMGSACKKAEGIFQKRINDIRLEISRNNEAFIDRRLESLNLSYRKSIDLRKELLSRAKENKRQDRYIRMLEGTVKRLEHELREKTKLLEQQRIVGVDYDEIAAGILEVI